MTIYINARPVLWDKPTISFAQIVEQWNKLDPERDGIGDLPGIDWTAKDGTHGVIYPSDKPMPVADELSFKIEYNGQLMLAPNSFHVYRAKNKSEILK